MSAVCCEDDNLIEVELMQEDAVLSGLESMVPPTVKLCNGASPTRSRHIARRVAYCADKARDGDFTFKHCNDEDNPADFLTKWLAVAKAEESIEYATNAKNAVEETPPDFKKKAQAKFDAKLRDFLAKARAAAG